MLWSALKNHLIDFDRVVFSFWVGLKLRPGGRFGCGMGTPICLPSYGRWCARDVSICFLALQHGMLLAVVALLTQHVVSFSIRSTR